MGRIPKYERIKNDLTDLIMNGTYAPGTELPSEAELIETYDVSRITIRRALEELYLENYIEKKQGKRACVRKKRKTQELNGISSYTEEILRQGMVPSRKVLLSGLRLGSGTEQEILKLDKADPVYCVERVIYADGIPLCYTITSVPYKYFRDIEQYDFSENSLYQVIEEDYHVEILSSSLKFKAVSADETVAGYLDMKKGAPLLFYSGITYGKADGEKRPVEYYKTYYSTNLFEYSLTQTRR